MKCYLSTPTKGHVISLLINSMHLSSMIIMPPAKTLYKFIIVLVSNLNE